MNYFGNNTCFLGAFLVYFEAYYNALAIETPLTDCNSFNIVLVTESLRQKFD